MTRRSRRSPISKGKTVGISVIGGGTYGPFAMMLRKNGVDPDKDIKLVEVGFAVSEDALRRPRRRRQHEPAICRACGGQGRHAQAVLAVGSDAEHRAHILEACRADFVNKNPELAKAYVADITLGMKKALANREETLKVVNEVMKAPIPVLETYLLKEKRLRPRPRRSTELPAMQKMLDIYTEAGMLPKMDAMQFKHPTIVAPIQ